MTKEGTTQAHHSLSGRLLYEKNIQSKNGKQTPNNKPKKPEGKGGREQPKKGNQRQKARTSSQKGRKIRTRLIVEWHGNMTKKREKKAKKKGPGKPKQATTTHHNHFP